MRRAVATTAGATAACLLGLALLAWSAWTPSSRTGHPSFAPVEGLLERRRPIAPFLGLSSLQRSPAVQVSCALDVSQALVRLMGAITGANSAKSSCSDLNGSDAKAKCSSDITGALYNFILLAAMISQSVVHCGETIDAPAACSAAVTGFIGNLGIVANGGSGLVYQCELWWRHHPVPPYGVTTTKATHHPTRFHWTTPPSPQLKLPPALPTLVPQEYWADNSNHENYEVDMTNCIVNMVLGTTNLGRAAISIMDQVKKCPIQAGQEACATDIVSLFGALGLAARYLSIAVVDCNGFFESGDSALAEADCTGAIMGVAGGAVSAAAQAMALEKACDDAVMHQHKGPLPR